MKRAQALPDSTKRCAIYTRKSTTMGLDQDFNSLDAQRESCLAYIESQPGWKLLDTHYDDGGFTGANIDRPAFQRLMADVDAGKIDIIVVYKVDRLSRSLLDFVKMMERLSSSGASFVSVTQNFSTADAMGRLTMNMLMSFAEFERSIIAERTRDKIAGARRRGKWTGGYTPFGYSLKDKKLVVNEAEAHIVKEIFALFLEHRQVAKVGQMLNERKHLPRRSHPGKHGILWSKDAIARMLRSPIYAGLMRYGDEVHHGEQPGIIDEATYHQVQKLLVDERKLHLTGKNPAYVLRGLLKCGVCGGAMTPASSAKGNKSWRYYRCSTRDKHGKKACAASQLPALAIEKFVVDGIAASISKDSGFVGQVERTLKERIEQRKKELLKIRETLPSKVASASMAASKYADELLKFEGRARELMEAKLQAETDRLVALERQLAEVESDLENLKEASEDLHWMVDTLRNFDSVWELLTPENQGRLLRALVDTVRVNEKDGDVEIELASFAMPQKGKAA